MTKSDYRETIEFLESIIHALGDDGRYHDYFENKKNFQKLQELRRASNAIFAAMPDLD